MALSVIAVFALAITFGVKWETLLVIAALLLCPAAMYFGMRGMNTREHEPGINTRNQPENLSTEDQDKDQHNRPGV